MNIGAMRALATVAMLMSCAVSCGRTDGELTVDDPWARPTPEESGVAAFYATVDNGSADDDVLLSARSTRCVTAVIHDSSLEDGVMSMAEATREQLTVAAGSSIALEPGGLHVMCLGMSAPLVVGESVDITLTFERAGDRALEVVIEQR